MTHATYSKLLSLINQAVEEEMEIKHKAFLAKVDSVSHLRHKAGSFGALSAPAPHSTTPSPDILDSRQSFSVISSLDTIILSTALYCTYYLTVMSRQSLFVNRLGKMLHVPSNTLIFIDKLNAI